MNFKTLVAFAALAVAGFSSCDPIDNAVDCHAICTRYKTCFDSDYDTDACTSRCRTNAKNDSDYKHDVDVCSACIDDQSCSSATFSCAGDCGNIVP